MVLMGIEWVYNLITNTITIFDTVLEVMKKYKFIDTCFVF